MTRRKPGTWLSSTRVKGLEHFAKQPLSAYDLGDLMWPGHKMAKVNGRAIVRELLLGEYIEPTQPMMEPQPKDGGDPVMYRATEKAAAVIANPPWLCRYCSTDVGGSMRRLYRFLCEGCLEIHQVCRWCRKYLIRPTGEFPYVVKVRACPGKIAIPKRPEPKKKEPESSQPSQQEFASSS